MDDDPKKRRSCRHQELIAPAKVEHRVSECLMVQTLSVAEEAIEQRKASNELRRDGFLRRYLKDLPPSPRMLFH